MKHQALFSSKDTETCYMQIILVLHQHAESCFWLIYTRSKIYRFTQTFSYLHEIKRREKVKKMLLKDICGYLYTFK